MFSALAKNTISYCCLLSVPHFQLHSYLNRAQGMSIAESCNIVDPIPVLHISHVFFFYKTPDKNHEKVFHTVFGIVCNAKMFTRKHGINCNYNYVQKFHFIMKCSWRHCAAIELVSYGFSVCSRWYQITMCVSIENVRNHNLVSSSTLYLFDGDEFESTIHIKHYHK